MLEAAAQLCSFYIGRHVSNDGFFGFGGIDEVRFRGVVQPGDRLVLIARGITVGLNRSQFATQGVVDGKLVFEAKLLGLRIR
jgi:3-hydroxyacyl-[acyl-carrier-protein] dehydratase